jgi:hypothetical protein
MPLSSPKASAYRGPCAAKSLGVPALRYRFGGDDMVGVNVSILTAFPAGIADAPSAPLEALAWAGRLVGFL